MRIRLAAALVILLAAPLAGEDLPEQAMDAYRRGDFNRAATLFSQAVEQESDSSTRAELRVKLAWTFFAMRQQRRAEEALTAALTDEPGLELVPDFYTDDFLALFARIKERRTQPRQEPSERIVRTPTPTLTAVRQRLLLAEDDETLARIQLEIEDLERSAPADQLPDILGVKSELMERLGRTELALELRGRAAMARAMAQLTPGTQASPPLELLLEARRLLAAHRPADAASLMRGVLAVLPSSLPALEILGQAHLEAGQIEEAQLVLRTALLHSERAETLMLLGEVELRRKDLPAARTAFRRAAQLERGNDRVAAALGLLAVRLGDMAGAREELDRALQLNGTLFAARVVRAQLALLEGETAQAVQHLQRALQVTPNDPWATGWMGAANLAAGDFQLASERLKTAVNGGENFFALLLAEATRRAGDPEEALRTLGTGEGHLEAEVALMRARCLMDLGRFPDAETALRTALTNNPGHYRLRALLAAALHRQRNWPAALGEVQRLIGTPETAQWASQAATRLQATNVAQTLLDQAIEIP